MKEEYIFEVVERLKIPVRGHYDENGLTPAEIVRLCNEIARIEREECAKICEPFSNGAWFASRIRSKA